MPVPVLVSIVHESRVGGWNVATVPLEIDQSRTLHSAGDTPVPNATFRPVRASGVTSPGWVSVLPGVTSAAAPAAARSATPATRITAAGREGCTTEVFPGHVTERSSNR